MVEVFITAFVLLILFLLSPGFLIIYNLLASFGFFIYKKLFKHPSNNINPREFWNTPFTILTYIWNLFGKIYHGSFIFILITLQFELTATKILNRL